jgi:two-component system, response regulator PdtaR
MGDHSKRVLLVEDEVFVAMSLAMDLRDAGYTVAATYATGEDAVAYLRESSADEVRIDAVLMDIGLAGEIDGVAAAEEIRTFSAVPIVFMTGYADREEEQAIADIRPLGFLVKPVSFSRLQVLLDSI